MCAVDAVGLKTLRHRVVDVEPIVLHRRGQRALIKIVSPLLLLRRRMLVPSRYQHGMSVPFVIGGNSPIASRDGKSEESDDSHPPNEPHPPTPR